MNVIAATEALASAAALRCAAELQVPRFLRDRPLDASELARMCGASERGSRVLLTALAGLGVVEPAGQGRYRMTQDGDLITRGVKLYDALADTVRTGQPAQAWDADLASEAYPRLVHVLGDAFRAAAERTADVLAGDGLRVLDVAAGAAPWSLAVAGRDPAGVVTAVDLPGVIAETQQAVKDRGAESRYRFLAGDAFSVNLGGPYDLALVGNFCHLFGPERNLLLLRRLREVLVPGGRVAIIDVVPPSGRQSPPQLALYELSLVLRTTSGAVHHFSAYVDWLTRSGYQSIERVDVDQVTGLTLVSATTDNGT